MTRTGISLFFALLTDAFFILFPSSIIVEHIYLLRFVVEQEYRMVIKKSFIFKSRIFQ